MIRRRGATPAARGREPTAGTGRGKGSRFATDAPLWHYLAGFLTPFVLYTVFALGALAFGATGGQRARGPDAVIRGLLCIHRYEASWSDGSGPYYGGLQFDAAFERAYGREYLRAFGHAGRWPRALQLAVGVRGYLARGWDPWRNTARLCGLR